MATVLPTYKGYMIDFRLKQFRKSDPEEQTIEFIDFDSPEGRKLLREYHEIEPNLTHND